MKRFILLAAALLMMVPTVEARRKTKKAGSIDGSVYSDGRYGFKFTVHDNWKAKINRDEDNFRIILTQRKYGTPARYQDAPDYTKRPRLAVYADTCTMGVYPLLDSLLSESFESEQKKAIMKEFEFFYEPEIIPKGLSRIEISGESGVLWSGQAKYVKEVQTSAGSVGGKREYGSYAGAVIAVKKGETVLLAHLMCEWEFFDSVLKEVTTMMTGLEWNEEGGES
ncbi:MAG TPA: hypothetical protein VMY05_03910 [Acidobacteriota bacterium]|nr:hypothetical protein [Acidobacteriota bacterium]